MTLDELIANYPRTITLASGSSIELRVMTAADRGFAVRGQFSVIEYEGKDTLCFCGAPWLFWIDSNWPDLRLSLTDSMFLSTLARISR